MKKRMYASLHVLALCLVIFGTGCKKDVQEKEDDSVPGTVSSTPVGKPVGELYTEFVGPAGGTVVSPDGRISIEIPEGALTKETEIGIEPLKNTSPGGIGPSFRLTPHGKIFKKKVSLSFSYKNDVRRISSTKALEVAYQNDKGVWTCIGGSVNDPVARTITIKTDHFSDWSFIASLELSPVVKTVGLSETVKLKALRYVHPMPEDFIVPLTIPEAGTGEPMTLESKYIVKWTLDGPGTLNGTGSEAVYTAPSAKPANKSATVTAELNIDGTKVLLISTINIIDEGVSIKLDNGPWQTYVGIANKMTQLNRYSFGNLRTSTDLPQIVCFWPVKSQRSDGTYDWNMLGEEESNVVFEYATPGLDLIYASVYDDENHTAKDSGGFLSVEEVEQDGKKYITGMFAIDNAGVYKTATAEQVKVGSVIGVFKVQRNW